jgi:hypothetical protein
LGWSFSLHSCNEEEEEEEEEEEVTSVQPRGMMRCPQNTQKPKLERTARGGQTKVKNKKE